MFAILGLRGARTTCCPSARSARWCIPTTSSSTSSPPSSPTPRPTLDRPRLPHAPRRRPLGLAAGALRAGAPAGRAGPASDRHRRRRHRAEDAWSRGPPPPTCACATRSRRSRKPSCCGTPTTGWCCAIRTSRSCTTCPTRRSRPARPTRRWSPPAASRSCATRSSPTGPTMPGARTFEAQLEDGRWLHISERRTKDGGYVSVGTDITALKTHEEKLIDSEKRLMATVADLRASQQRLGRTRREIRRGEDPRRGSQPGQVEIPRQYEPRAAHAAQRHHRLLRDHGVRACSAPLGAEKYDEYCRDIRGSGQYLLDVINDMLDMSKIEAGRIRLDFEDVDARCAARRRDARRVRRAPRTSSSTLDVATSRRRCSCAPTAARSSRSRSICCRTR